MGGILRAGAVGSGALGVLGAELFVTWSLPAQGLRLRTPDTPRAPRCPQPDAQLWECCGKGEGGKVGGRGLGSWVGAPSPPRRMDVTVTAGPDGIRWSDTVVGRQDGDQGQTEGVEVGDQGPGAFSEA